MVWIVNKPNSGGFRFEQETGLHNDVTPSGGSSLMIFLWCCPPVGCPPRRKCPLTIYACQSPASGHPNPKPTQFWIIRIQNPLQNFRINFRAVGQQKKYQNVFEMDSVISFNTSNVQKTSKIDFFDWKTLGISSKYGILYTYGMRYVLWFTLLCSLPTQCHWEPSN